MIGSCLRLIEDFTAEKERETLNRNHTEQLRKAHDDLERKVEATHDRTERDE